MDIGTIIREVEIVRTTEVDPFDPRIPDPSLPLEPVPEHAPAEPVR